jgi:hypothetical protein
MLLFSFTVLIAVHTMVMVHLQIAEIRPDLAIRAEIPSVFVLETFSSFRQRFGQFRMDYWQGF